MILLLTEPRDVHADHVAEILRRRQVPYFRFDPEALPARAELSFALTAGGEARYGLRLDEELLDLGRVTAVWLRRPGRPAAHQELTDPLMREFIEGECQYFVDDVWNSLDCLWVPARPAVNRRGQCKGSQLRTAGALGFELPPTLISNSRKDFLAFYRRHNGNVISKLAGFSFYRTVGERFARFTEVVTKRDLGHADAIRYCPMIFQAYVPKRFELRITVVGEQVFAAEIHSQDSNHTRHDWRRYDHFKTAYRVHELPADTADRCVRLVRALGLCYGAIDMVLTPDGRYVFLEINTNGQYRWIEQATELPISDALCDLLTSGAPACQPAEDRIEAALSGGGQ
jgi:hypothetical protein